METTKNNPLAKMDFRLLFLLLISWTALIGAILFIRIGQPTNSQAHQEAAVLSVDGQFNSYIFENGSVPQSPTAIKEWYGSHPRADKTDLAAATAEFGALQSILVSKAIDIEQSPAFAVRLALLELWTKPSQDGQVIGARIGNLFGRTHSALSRNYLNAVLAACTELEQYTANTPHYPEALAFRGMASAKKAALAHGNMDRITQIDAGLKLLDQAVALAPANLNVRIIRAYTDLNVPPFLRRETQGWEDALTVLEHSSQADLQQIILTDRQDLLAELHKQKVVPASFAQRFAACEAQLAGLISAQGVNK